MHPVSAGKITLLFLLLVPGEVLLAQTSLKFESGGGPSGSGPSTTNKVVTMYYGDGAVYSPATTVTYSLSDQAYTAIEGSSTTPGVVFGGDINGSGNSLTGRNYYGLMNQVGGSTNAHYSLDGATPAINVANDYAVNIMAYTDALITSGGSNIMPTSTKNIYFAKLKLTFSRPVSNPIVHFTGMGGFYMASSSSGSLGFAAGFKLNEDYTISKLAGNTFFQVSDADKTIYNSAAKYTSSTNSSSPSGASGSVKITGTNITTLTFDVLMNGDGTGSSPWSATNRVNGDVFLVSTSLSAYDITGTVHNDNNGGTPDGPGYEGATVTLKDAEGNVVATTTTDADGNYTFSDIVAGDYTVEITTPDGFEIVGASDGDTDGSTAISLTENISGIDFGINEPPVATDDNLTGQSPGSPATINLIDNDSDPNSGTLSPDDISLIAPEGATDILTDAEGDITGFTVPGEGTWLLNDDGTLTFTPEDGFLGDPTPVQYTVRDAAGLTSDPATVTIDYNDPVTVSGTVHNDNNDGTPDGPGYEGATVTLKDAEGNVVATTTTDADGNYSFNNIIPGDYTVEITSPDGFEIVGASDGDTDGSTAITVGSENISGIDFGINEPPVATDDNLAGQSPGSPATINILGNDSDPNSGTLSPDDISLIAPEGATDILTDAEGDITGFTVPGEGSWLLNDDGTLTFTPEAGFTGDPTPVQYTVRDAAGLTSNPATVTIDYNDLVTVSGTVHNDNNGGTPDGPGYEGATVTLKDAEGNVVAMTTTDADGNYTFTDVIPGDYTVEITSPDGFEIVGASDGDTDGSTAITVGSENISGIDFGINEPPVATDDNLAGQSPGSPATINLIDNDSDPNSGTLSPDDISLIAPEGATDILTDAEGDITGFTVPGEGSWLLNDDGTLTFTPEAGFTGDPTPVQYTVRDAAGLTSNPATVTIDYNDLVTVSGTVHNDNNDGTPDGPGYEGATVTLKDAEGNVIATTTTDADGNYSFNNIIPGDYTVEITSPDGFEIVGASDGDTDGSTAITVGSENISGIDFGINEPPVATDDNLAGQSPGSPATINLIDNDSDPNSGTLSPDDISLIAPEGATDILTDAEGNITGFTVPGEGTWLLNDDGTLTFTPEAGFTGDPTPVQYTVRDAAGLTSNPATVTIDYNDPVTVSGTVHNDNNDGTPDGPGYEGATVTLKDAEGNVVATTTTDADGNYTFTDVIPGDYTVEITSPDGFEIVGASDGDTDGSTAITVGSEPVNGIDFGINEPPVATDDNLAGQSPGSPATINLIDNDSDPNSGTLSPDDISLIAPEGATDILTDAEGDITGFTVPGEGTWLLNDDGTLTFTPEDGFLGDPTPIQYTVRDAAGLTSDPATVTIDYNDPVTVSGTVHNDNNGGTPDGPGYEGATVTLKDAEGNIVATTTTDADGNYSFNNIIPGDYTVEITSPDGFEIVGASDGDTDGSTAITVGSENISGIDFGINEPPVATDDLLSGQSPGSPATINLIDNDSDPNSGTLSPDDISLIAPEGATDILTDAEGDITGFTVPGEGSWLLNDDGTLTFTPEDGFTGDPTPVQYTVRDAAGLTSDPATVTITYDEPLPVDLVSFTVNADGCQPVLTWATATEKDFDRFEIERSYNGRDFKMLTAAPAKGDKSSYTYSDATAAEGNNFYRLKMVDRDAGYSYSAVVKATVACNVPDINIYPNPADGFIRISGLKGGEIISITDMAGRSLRVLELNDINQPVDIQDLAQGVYNIIITDALNNRQVVRRLVKR